MKMIMKICLAGLLVMAPFPIFAQNGDELSPLIMTLKSGGLAGLESRLDAGMTWPRITSDFRAKSEGVGEGRQRELVALAGDVLEQLRAKSLLAPGNEDDLNKEATL